MGESETIDVYEVDDHDGPPNYFYRDIKDALDCARGDLELNDAGAVTITRRKMTLAEFEALPEL